MTRIPLTARVHRAVESHISEGDIVIDATAGNGHDTLFLARCVGESGQVYSLDIQPQAIKQTRQRLDAAGMTVRIRLFQCGHEQMLQQIPTEHHQQVSTIIFNLGYLPSADKSVITTETTTITALNGATELLKPGGYLSILAYPGHPGGREETEAVKAWANELANQQFEVSIHPPAHDNGKSPEWIEIRKSDAF